MKTRKFLTFDIDWAPDVVIEDVYNILVKKNIKSTWFVTHRSPIIEKMREKKDLFELGLHPNFLKSTTQGQSNEDIINHVKEIIPESKVARSHSLKQSGHILSDLVRYGSILIDSSIFLPEMPNIIPVSHFTPYGKLIRMPFFWADDHELIKTEKNWNYRWHRLPGYQIFLFHPIHIYLNSNNLSVYTSFKNSILNYQNATIDELSCFHNSKNGTNTMFKQILRELENSGSNFLIDCI